jgi:hypothetical protein
MVSALGVGREASRRKVITLDWGELIKRQFQCLSDWNRWDHVFSGLYAFSSMLLFPNLKFAILDEFSGFESTTLMDHAHAYREHASKFHATTNFCELIVFSAAGCYDLDFSLSAVSDSLISLWFLDISGTSSDEGWLQRFANAEFPNLRVLKLHNLRLTDRGFIAIKGWLTQKLWSLDLSNNNFTDVTIPKILDHIICYRCPRSKPDPNGPNALSLYYEDAPSYVANDRHANSIAPLRPDSKHAFIEYLEKNGHFSTPHTPVLDENDPLARVTGITHLYLAHNKFTSVGIRNLLNSTVRLQVLDVGSVRGEPSLLPGSWTYAQVDSVSPLLSTSGSMLESLRIHHSIVTHTPSALHGDGRIETTDPNKIGSNEKVGLRESYRWSAFNPNDNHRITELKLTGIPTKSKGFVIQKLIGFLKQCAEQEAHINQMRASQGQQTRHSPRLLSGLRTLTLEFMHQASSQIVSESISGSSVSGDRDADNFLSQQMQDFSFFTSESEPRPPARSLVPSTPLLDVEAALKKFRASEEGQKWTGKIKIRHGVGLLISELK